MVLVRLRKGAALGLGGYEALNMAYKATRESSLPEQED